MFRARRQAHERPSHRRYRIVAHGSAAVRDRLRQRHRSRTCSSAFRPEHARRWSPTRWCGFYTPSDADVWWQMTINPNGPATRCDGHQRW